MSNHPANVHLPLPMAIVGVLITLLLNVVAWAGFVKLICSTSHWYDAVSIVAVGVLSLVWGAVSVAIVEWLLYTPGFGALAQESNSRE